MTDDQLLLANAYLDDELGAVERARAETDPEVMAEVARLADVRQRLQAVDPPDPARREAAITAALAEIDLPATSSSPTAPPTPLRRRRMWLPVAAAAAVIAIAIAGVAILADRSGGDDSDTASFNAATAPVARQATEAAGVAPTIAGAATAAGAATTAGGAATTAAAVTTTTAAAATTTTVPTPKAPAAAPAPSLAVLDSPAALATFASQRTAQQLDAATLPPTCTGGRYVGPADYVRGGEPTPVEVFVVDRDAVARDATTCTEVARAPLP